MSELKIMSHLGHHENIVNLLGACTYGGRTPQLCFPRGHLPWHAPLRLLPLLSLTREIADELGGLF